MSKCTCEGLDPSCPFGAQHTPKDEIIEMARKAGNFKSHSWPEPWVSFFEAFAKLVDAKATEREREACAKLADEWHEKRGLYGMDHFAKAIRARGNP